MSEISQIELLAQIDDLSSRLQQWADEPLEWAPLQKCQALVRRTLARVETLRVRLEAPLVVATFGGTGTGKSSLVNALVGEDCTQSGRQRPTTLQPIIIAHSRTDVSALGIPLSDCRVVTRDNETLRDIVIIDCPDPDTNESETPGSNLARLHALLPYCDVLLYCSTQQKYRSQRVVSELAQAASGCRLIFVQTHADTDTDIRDDWRKQLRSLYEVPEVFFVDSVKALREQQAGQRPAGEMGRLLDLLTRQLGASERVRVRRANVLDLAQAALTRCRQIISEARPGLDKLQQALVQQREDLARKMTQRLCDDLLVSRSLWERRLTSAVLDNWGVSPFSCMLRLYHGLGAILASMSFFRARTTAQMALIGVVQGARWLDERRESQSAEQHLENLESLGLADSLLKEAELVMAGHVRSAGLPPRLVQHGDLGSLRQHASRMEQQFLGDVGRRLDEIVKDLARRNSRWWTRGCYELLFLLYLGFVLARMGKNFFYDTVLNETAEYLKTEFYVSAGVFFVIWSGLLVINFTRHLRQGLSRRIADLSRELIDVKLSRGLFPQLEEAVRAAVLHGEDLTLLAEATTELRDRFAGTAPLGGVAPARPVEAALRS